MKTNTIFNQPIILDNGSGTIRCGFAGEEKPKVNYSNLLGKPKYHRVMPSSISETDTFVGNKAQSLRGLLKLTYPIEHGIVRDWDSLEIIWQNVLLDDLGVNSLQEHPILITEEPLNPRQHREKLAELLFENFNIPAVHFSLPSVLSLYSTGRTTGIVLDVGDGVSSVVPVYEGFVIPGSVKRMNIAGRDITEQLKNELMRNGYFLNSSSEFEIIRNLKERLGYVSVDNNNNEMENAIMDSLNNFKTFRLPDGKLIKVDEKSLSKPCEILFNPENFGFEEVGIHENLYNSILKTDVDLRSKLFETIILSGGTTLFKNFGSRLLKELQNNDSELNLKIYASPDRKISCYIGGSILASLSTFKNILIAKNEYHEDPNCVHDRFF